MRAVCDSMVLSQWVKVMNRRTGRYDLLIVGVHRKTNNQVHVKEPLMKLEFETRKLLLL